MGMQFSIEHIREGNYLKVSILVPVTRDLANECAQQARQACDQAGCNGYLFDMRNAPNDSTVHDNYEFAHWDLKEMGIEPRMKGAVLIAANDETHFLPISMLRTAGYDVHDFTDEQEALAWLADAE